MQGPCKGYTGACQCSTLPTFHWQAVSGWPVLGNVAEVEYKCPRAVPGAIACLVNATILAINIFITLVCQHQYRLHNMSVFGENKNITKILASPDYEIISTFVIKPSTFCLLHLNSCGHQITKVISIIKKKVASLNIYSRYSITWIKMCFLILTFFHEKLANITLGGIIYKC